MNIRRHLVKLVANLTKFSEEIKQNIFNKMRILLETVVRFLVDTYQTVRLFIEGIILILMALVYDLGLHLLDIMRTVREHVGRRGSLLHALLRKHPVRNASVILVTVLVIALLFALIGAFVFDQPDTRNELFRFIEAVRKGTSDSTTSGIRIALVSLGGATFGATAIGVTLSIFLFQQNIQRLQYRTSTSIYRNKWIAYFASATITLAVADYVLAVIITRHNAYVVCVIALALAALFGRTVVSYFKSIVGLLDLQVPIERTFLKYETDTSAVLANFKSLATNLENQVQGLHTFAVHEIGHNAEDRLLHCANRIQEHADGCVEELIQIALVLARQGDYKSAGVACQKIAQTCVSALSIISYMFDRFREVVKIKFEYLPNFRETFARTGQIVRLAAKESDVNLYQVAVRMYSEIARSTAPGALSTGGKFSRTNALNAIEPFLHIRNTALIGSRDEFSDAPVICLDALAELVNSWTQEVELFCSFYGETIKNIAIASLANRNAGLAEERALGCLVALLRVIWENGLAVSELRSVFHQISTIVEATKARYLNSDLTPRYPLRLDIVIRTSDVLYFGRQTIFQIIETACADHIRPERAKIRAIDLPRLIALVDAYLNFLHETGETIAGTVLADAPHIVETMCKCLELCIRLRHALPQQSLTSDDPNVASLDALKLRTLKTLPDDAFRLYKEDLSLGALELTFYLDDLAILASEHSDEDAVVAVVQICLQLAHKLTQNDEQSAIIRRCFYLAIIIGALDKSARSLSLISEAVRSGFWADFAAKSPDPASEIRSTFEIADEARFRAQLSAILGKRIVEAVAFEPIRRIQGAVLQVMDAARMDSPESCSSVQWPEIASPPVVPRGSQ
jgi:hypothetical protein